jgi:hypothetical protein
LCERARIVVGKKGCYRVNFNTVREIKKVLFSREKGSIPSKGYSVIYIFRKEMKKWHTVLWVVFVALGVSTGSFFFFRSRNPSEMAIATVNGRSVYFDAYKHQLADVHARIEYLRPLARMYGMSEQAFLSTFLGAVKPEELALDMCVRDALIDYVREPLNLELDDIWFKNELIKTVPHLADGQGHINMEAYHSYLQRLSTSPSQYENFKREAFKRDVAQNLVQGTLYIPRFAAQEIFDTTRCAKSFALVEFPMSYFMAQAKKMGASDAALEKFYLTNKSWYEVGEKRNAKYWLLAPSTYAQTVEVDEQSVRNFYEKNKSKLYRIPPKIKVRHILMLTQDQAVAIQKQAVQQPGSFAALAKQHSQDNKTAASGGLTEMFGHGTYDSDFERAAFRLRTDGEISPVVKTTRGYEVIQLVQRIQANEKSFDAVKNDITQQLRAKRSLSALRGDLEQLAHAAREDSQAISRFVTQHQLQTKESGWVLESETRKDDVLGKLAQQLFSPTKRLRTIGYFTHDDYFVLYQPQGVEKSYTPPLAQVKETVLQDYLAEQADNLAHSTLKSMRARILTKKATLEEVARESGGSFKITKKTDPTQPVAELGNEGAALSSKLFSITDASQVLELATKTSFYLAQLNQSTPLEGASFAAEASKIIKQEKYKENTLCLTAFIASLYRNAKIETDREIMKMRHVDVDTTPED